jgi:hypothetical protein
MGKPLPLTLLGVIKPCHLHDVWEMTRPDDTTDTICKHGGSLCYTSHMQFWRAKRYIVILIEHIVEVRLKVVRG